MTKSFLRLLAAVLLSFSAGCISSNASDRDSWRNVRADELIDRRKLGKSMTVGLNIYVFHIQADKLTEIQELIAQTSTIGVKYSDPDAFLANGLMSCAGDRTSWQKIGQSLSQSQPEIKERIGLLVAENMTDDVIISETLRPVSVVYLSEGTTTGIGFGTGQIVLRINATPLIGLRQICGLDITPVYKTGSKQKAEKRPVGWKNYEFVFDSAALNVRLRPGQFLLIAPAQAEAQQADTQIIGDVMFYPEGSENTVNLCIIACGFINDPL